jgi:hypothetical protein
MLQPETTPLILANGAAGGRRYAGVIYTAGAGRLRPIKTETEPFHDDAPAGAAYSACIDGDADSPEADRAPPTRRTAMIRFTRMLATFALAAVSAAAFAQQPAVADYTVFVDPPTGFTFVKLPSGWKFVGQVAIADQARLPATVVTSLLPAEENLAMRLAAAETAKAPTRR